MWMKTDGKKIWTHTADASIKQVLLTVRRGTRDYEIVEQIGGNEWEIFI